VQQDKISSANRAAINRVRAANRKDGQPPKLVEHDVGDLILYWEPAQPKTMQTALQRLTSTITTNATADSFEPGWRSTNRPNSRTYYTQTPKKATGIPCTTDIDGLRMNQTDVLMHSSDLTDSGRLPAPLLRAIARHPYI
jgi:hypothetical protein